MDAFFLHAIIDAIRTTEVERLAVKQFPALSFTDISLTENKTKPMEGLSVFFNDCSQQEGRGL
ncbi:MAG: hypothetical protein DRJ08_03010 [Acidobacteria bacterium]|nr:MAG: hypothetical protein DRJ14_06130 [Acidobacteriota bacterium]RLE23131.1 MAG: hypothetical protein DRJ08_03010 [Acidobacteriota bacterium]